MGSRQAYSVINCLIYLPLCFFGIVALFLRVIAVVAVNPVIVSCARISLMSLSEDSWSLLFPLREP